MRLTVFQAGKGDCLLLTAADGTNVLIDGGMRDAYREHVAPALGTLRDEGGVLDLVYLSHIDQDHISGVLQLMDDLVSWRVYEYQQAAGNERFPKPIVPRPPEVTDLWHNAFRETAGQNTGPIEEMLAATAGLLETRETRWALGEALRQRELATSVAEGIELSRRASREQLGIEVNRHFGRKLALARPGAPSIPLGSLAITLIGPFPEDLAALRRDWNKWLRKRETRAQHERLRRRMERDADRLHTSELELLRGTRALASEELGDRSQVTVPNLASLMLLVEENGRSILLTGDGHHLDILKGLAQAGRLNSEGGIHVDVLKVQHHGSEHNLNPAFARLVTADHYLFCANGEHENPDGRVVRAILDSRLGPESRRSKNPEVQRPFAFHFNSSGTATEGTENRAHMRAIERQAGNAAAASAGQLTASFLEGSSFQLKIE